MVGMDWKYGLGEGNGFDLGILGFQLGLKVWDWKYGFDWK